jgi:hypothetical protein
MVPVQRCRSEVLTGSPLTPTLSPSAWDQGADDRGRSGVPTERTSTRLSKNVAPPPMSASAADEVLLTFVPPGTSLFQ